MNSRGAATECSPGREPGVFFRHDLSPGRKSLSESFAPSGLRSRTTPTPGLRRGLHSVAAPRLNTAQVLARAHSGSFLDRNHNLDRSAVARRECALPTQYLLSELLTRHTSGLWQAAVSNKG